MIVMWDDDGRNSKTGRIYERKVGFKTIKVDEMI